MEGRGKDRRHWAGLAEIFIIFPSTKPRRFTKCSSSSGLHPTGHFITLDHRWLSGSHYRRRSVSQLLGASACKEQVDIVLTGTLYVEALGVEMVESRYQYVHGPWSSLPSAPRLSHFQRNSAKDVAGPGTV